MVKVKAIMILEVLGRPADYVIESVSLLIENIKKEKGVKVLNQKIADSKKVENKDLFSSFAEIEIETENILILMDIMFRYMPAHIELIEPEKMQLETSDWNSILNNLAMKLHRYDELTKILSIEKQILTQQIMLLKEKFGIKDQPAAGKVSKPEKKARKAKKK
jgi:hypothetical protein